MTRRVVGCARYRPLLIDFVDRGEVLPGTEAALAHLDYCATCTEVIESTMLTILALRRMGDDAAAAAEALDGDAWPRLRGRIERWRQRPRVMSPLTGIAMSFALVAVLVMPLGLGGSVLGPVASQRPVPAAIPTALDRVEVAYIAAIRQAGLPAGSLASSAAAGAIYPRIYPDNSRIVRKEVSSDQRAGRSAEAI